MAHLFRAAIAVFATLTLAAATPLPKYDFDPVATRNQLLGLLSQYQPTEWVVDPPATPGSQAEKLIEFYKQNLVPVDQRISQLILKYQVYSQLLDAGLYDNEDERTTWQKVVDGVIKDFSEIESDPTIGKNKVALGQLAEGLPGEFARSARLAAEQARYEQFDESAQPLLEEESKLHVELNLIANKSPFKSAFEKSQRESSQILTKYFAGKMTMDEATRLLEANEQAGTLAYGRDIAQRGKDALNRSAELRTRLAQMKGFKTNAEFKLASQAIAHAPEFKSKDVLLKFLYGLLDATDGTMRRYYEVRAKKLGFASLMDVRPSQLTLLGFPTYLLMREYYPKERHAPVWKQTMMDNGFPQSVVEHVMLDVFPRDKKNSHAYMKPIRRPWLKTQILNGETLEPVPQPDSAWAPADIYILQNFNDDGLADLRTAFHEGGHFLDYSYQRDQLGYPDAYGYSETHSTTMEGFIEDREFLLAYGQARDGRKVTPETVDLFLKRKAVSELSQFRYSVVSAIFDIEVWDYDYVNGPATYVERVEEVSSRLRPRLYFVPQPTDLPSSEGFEKYTTDHFRSGIVRHYGYVLASVSAELMRTALYDRLEALTGRRSFYQQPQMAKLLIDGIYRDGFAQPFPRSIEKFTGKPFSPQVFAASLTKEVDDFVDELEK